MDQDIKLQKRTKRDTIRQQVLENKFQYTNQFNHIQKLQFLTNGSIDQ